MNQEEAVRRKLIAQGYTQPYGSSDEEIRRNLGIKGKCADFVDYNPELDRWLVGESKGSNVDRAYYQLVNTIEGLLAKEPGARGKIDLYIYLDPQNYETLTTDVRGLSGNELRGGFLGNYDEHEVWHFAEIEGQRIRVIKEQG